MPYVILKKGPGYKVCKKSDHSVCFSKKPMPKARAERQIAAMHINTNESLENNYVGPFMFKRVFVMNNEDQTEYGVSYQLRGGTITFYYKFEENAENVEFKRGFVNDPGADFILPFNEEDQDFEDKLSQVQNKYKISFDELELAIQDGYERIKDYSETEQKKSEEIKNKYDVAESLSFEKYFKTIFESHGAKLVSNCCGAKPSALTPDVEKPGDVGICSNCKEHAEFESEEE